MFNVLGLHAEEVVKLLLKSSEFGAKLSHQPVADEVV